MNYMLTNICDSMFVPSLIENLIVFIDICNLSVFNLPTKLVTQIIEVRILIFI